MAQVQPTGLFGATPATTLCCLCGIPLKTSSENNTCANCVAATVSSVAQRVPKSYTMIWCKGCERYLKPPASWVPAELESKELMAICLSKIMKLEKARITDAKFIWTEPHSRRIKIRMTAQEQHPSSLQIVQESFTIEYVVQTMQCPDCTRLAAKNTWVATVQVRQRVNHKRTFLYLEQLMLKSQIHKRCSNIKEAKNGVDFQFLHKNQAQQMQTWLESAVPCKSSWSERIISTDVKSNTRNSKWTCVTELAPVCKEDLVALDSSTRKILGGIGPVALCYRVYSTISFVDPFTLKCFTLNMQEFMKYEPKILMSMANLSLFYVIDSEEVTNPHEKSISEYARHGFRLARVTVGRAKDSEVFTTLSHIGHYLKAGDEVLAYDFTLWNGQDGDERDEWHSDVVIVRKHFAKRKKRAWKLKRLDMLGEEDNEMDVDQTDGNKGIKKRSDEMKEVSRKRQKIDREKRKDRTIRGQAAGSRPKTQPSDADVERFMQELEEDADMRSRVNLYKAEEFAESEREDSDAESAPEIPLGELLDDLKLE